jgi:hypothetical protein
MQEKQSPLFKTLDKLVGSTSARPSGQPSGPPPDESNGPPARGARGGGGGGALLPDTAKVVLDRLADIQDAYRDRALAKLDNIQRQRVDSIQAATTAALREKAEKERAAMEKRRERGER